jgi:hypothetical protein
MALPVTIPNTFANATTSIPLSQLDNNFSTLSTAINGINSGAETLANLKSSNVTITGGTISNVTLDNVNVNVETFSNVTLVNVTVTSGTFTGITAANIAGANISSGNATLTNVTATQANLTTANVANLQTANAQITGGTITVSDITLNAQGDVRFADADSSNWVAFQGPATVASNITWTLPATDGSSGEVLSTNGSGTLSWTAGGGGGGITTGKSIAMAMIFGF